MRPWRRRFYRELVVARDEVAKFVALSKGERR
jgi:hypothetical protein